MTHYTSNQAKLYLPLSSGYLQVLAVPPLTVGQVLQVDATFDGTTASLYTDGALDGFDATDGGALGFMSLSGLAIGSTPYQLFSRPMFAGKIAQVSLYPVALSAEQVQAHFQATGLPGSACQGSTSTTGS